MIAKFSLVNECSKNKCIYSNKSYIALFEKVYNSQAKYIKISNSKNNAFIPFIKRKLKNDNYEAFSCYGYGGIFGNKITLTEGDITNLKNFYLILTYIAYLLDMHLFRKSFIVAIFKD